MPLRAELWASWTDHSHCRMSIRGQKTLLPNIRLKNDFGLGEVRSQYSLIFGLVMETCRFSGAPGEPYRGERKYSGSSPELWPELLPRGCQHHQPLTNYEPTGSQPLSQPLANHYHEPTGSQPLANYKPTWLAIQPLANLYNIQPLSNI